MEEVFVRSLHHPLYFISSEGRVFSYKRGRFLKHIVASRNFVQVSLDGKNVTLHKEMAESFANAEIGRVWFRDNNKANLTLKNLDWALADARPQEIKRPKLYLYTGTVFIPLS